MKGIASILVLCAMALIFSSCACMRCNVSLPGGCCEPCPKPPKKLCPPRPEKQCNLPIWPDRPVRCVVTQVCRKCCRIEKCCTPEGYEYEVEICEITYKSLYTDGSTRVWTEVRKDPIQKGPKRIGRNSQNPNHYSQPLKGSLVGNRCP